MIRNENGFLAGLRLRRHRHERPGGLRRTGEATSGGARVPSRRATTLEWSGQYENLLRVRERLKLVVPVVLVVIALLLYAEHPLAR